MIKDLEQALGYHFQNITLLQNALTHSSYANERWRDLASNERLEFLGDSILGMVTAEHLYRTFPHRSEGELSRIRADLVCEANLARVAGRLHLGDYLLLGHGEEQGGGRTRESILADAVESVLAAAYLDGGFSAAGIWSTASSSQTFRRSTPGIWTIRPSSRSWSSRRRIRSSNTNSPANPALTMPNSSRWRFGSTAPWWGRGPAAAKSGRSKRRPEWRWSSCSQHCSL